jgi:hypothetical protein
LNGSFKIGLTITWFFMAKNVACTDDFLVLSNPNIIEIWSTKRLQFEPKGWQISLRDRIRSGLSAITVDSNEFLQAVYISPIKEACDAENILFYNIGNNFFPAKLKGFRFERVFSIPPSPPKPFGKAIEHYQRYHAVPCEAKYEYWAKKGTIVEFETQCFKTTTLLENPAFVWFSIKCGSKKLDFFPSSKPAYFGLRLAVNLPFNTSKNIVSLVKPLFDGVIAAFHSHDGTNQQEISRRISSVINQPVDIVSSYLSDNENAVLGARTLLYLRSKGIQWNPADHLCVLGELSFEKTTRSNIHLSGELFLLESIGT